MKTRLRQKRLVVKQSLIQGYGVFADEDMLANDVIEECYLLPAAKKEIDFVDYYFGFGEQYAIALGFGSIYNHGTKPNATYHVIKEQQLLVIRAARQIKKGEEILISYGDQWFSSRNAPMISAYRWYHWANLRPFAGMIGRMAIVLLVMSYFYLFIHSFFSK